MGTDDSVSAVLLSAWRYQITPPKKKKRFRLCFVSFNFRKVNSVVMLCTVYETSSTSEEIEVFLCQNYQKIFIINFNDFTSSGVNWLKKYLNTSWSHSFICSKCTPQGHYCTSIFLSTWEWTNMLALCKCMFIIIITLTIQNNETYCPEYPPE